VEAETDGSLPLVPDLARPGPERQFRHRLGVRQIHRAVLNWRVRHTEILQEFVLKRLLSLKQPLLFK
jgi:hypothetical protein